MQFSIPMKWPRPDYVSMAWQIDTAPTVIATLIERMKTTGLDPLDAWQRAAPEPTFRTSCPPFYPGLMLVEMQLERAFDEGTLLASFLVPRQEVGGNTVPGPLGSPGTDAVSEGIYWLDGTSGPIHDANEHNGLSATTAEHVLGYLRFFCAHVWGDNGAFWIVDEVAALPWYSDAPAEMCDRLSKAFIPLSCTAGDDGHWSVDATVLYGSKPFKARFDVDARKGLIEMVEDEPLVLSPPLEHDLPVLDDHRNQGYRVLPANLNAPPDWPARIASDH